MAEAMGNAKWMVILAVITALTNTVSNGGQFALGKDTRKTASESVEMGAACRELLEASTAEAASLRKELRECMRECVHVQSEHVAKVLMSDPYNTCAVYHGPGFIGHDTEGNPIFNILYDSFP